MVRKRLVPASLTIVAVLVLLGTGFSGSVGADSGQNVQGGSTFATATPIDPIGLYHSHLGFGSSNHYYRFQVDVGEPINIEIRPFCNTGGCEVLSSGSLFAPDNNRRLGFRLLSPQGAILDTANTNQGDARVMVSAAPMSGEYRFHVTSQMSGFSGDYSFCFLRPPDEPHPCPDIRMEPQSVIFGGTLSNAQNTRVLLIPPAHGDLGNPLGPTALDYLDAAIDGIREWERVLSEFADDYPEYHYLDQITVDIQIFDGTQITANYDIVISYMPTGGTQFRGFASTCTGGTRCIALSLFSMAPRSGQTLPDYPEYNDMEAVTKHEFAHVWGLGHTLTWTEEHGPDLMNSPATFVYGDGSPVGDGGERTAKQCISSLNLYGMALLFQHLVGRPRVTGGEYTLPDDIPYEWYC